LKFNTIRNIAAGIGKGFFDGCAVRGLVRTDKSGTNDIHLNVSFEQLRGLCRLRNFRGLSLPELSNRRMSESWKTVKEIDPMMGSSLQARISGFKSASITKTTKAERATPMVQD